MVDSQKRVGLAATKSSLQLNNRVAPLARQPLDDGVEQEAHAFGNECPLEEEGCVLIFRRRYALMHLRNVGCEFGLLEGALQDIFVRDGDFAPRF